MLKKKFNLVVYIVAIVFILFFTLNGFKLYSIKERDIENNNKVILEEEKFNDYSLKLSKDINYNKLYVYKLKNDEYYVFIYSKSFIFDSYNLDDKFSIRENSLNTVAKNFKYKNNIKIDLDKEPLKVDVKSNKNFETRNIFIKFFVIFVLIFYLGYRKDKRKNLKH
ncbi:hypothetical protein [Peptoniphilus gorbachii]|uniref:Uncharacterized protein n=1 Tax=Peptoniphilus gorbachii TaxID=411567 RepID=A0A6N3CS02_9FIRM|nr:hypothetical protein [Peptoniphilus harei]